jgi:hypothetical protein
MPVRPSLLSEIQSALGQAITPNLTAASAASDLFEAYILGLVIEAARAEGASVSYEDVRGNTPITFVFRTSPGHIFSTTHPYTHAMIEFPNKPVLEAHIGVRVAGKSEVLHECDVAVIRRDEAVTCRRNGVPPRSRRVVLAVECKFYSTHLPLNLAGAFVGLVSDLSIQDCYFVFNISSDSVEQFLARRLRYRNRWEHQIIPSSAVAVSRLQNLFQDTFKIFKASN